MADKQPTIPDSRARLALGEAHRAADGAPCPFLPCARRLYLAGRYRACERVACRSIRNSLGDGAALESSLANLARYFVSLAG